MNARTRQTAKALLWVPLLILAFAAPGWANAPVAKLTQVEGNVEYSKDGDSWRAVRRNKYLFDGYQVRTGSDGSARLVDQESGDVRELGAETKVLIESDGAELLAGNNLSQPEESGTSFWQALVNKFSSAQRYTTVRRSVVTGPEAVEPPETLTVSSHYDEVVWSNAGPEYRYRVEIDGLPLTKNGSLKVELVPMPSSDNPWRIRADYLSEQRRDTVRFYITIATLIIAIISVISTTAVAIATIKGLS